MSTITILLSLAIALNVAPQLRGPDEWRWHFGIPSRPIRHLIPASTVIAYVAVATYWVKRLIQQTITKRERGAFLLFLIISVPAIQASLYTVEDPDILEQLFYRTVSSTSNGVFSVGSTINAPINYLRHYPERMPTYPVHPQRYPPGLPLLFYGARRLLESLPQLSNAIASQLRLYQCHNLILMRLPNSIIASAVVQMALPIICGLTVLPIYGLAHRAGGRRIALWAAMLYPLVPSFNLWYARWDAFYALLAATIWYLFHVGLTEYRHVLLTASGLLLCIASFFSFGNLALLLPLGSWTVLWLVTHQAAWTWKQLITALLAFAIGLISLWILYQITLGTGFFDIWRVSMSYHLGLKRNYWLWLGYHIYDFFLFLGLPLAFLTGLAGVMGVHDFPRRRETILPLSFGLGFLLLDLSGMAQGEVARVWLFLTPFAVITAAYGLSHLQKHHLNLVLTASLLAAQLLTFNAFLRVVNTGLYDPPSRERLFTSPNIPHPQNTYLGDHITLLGYDIAPRQVHPGQTIHLTLYWQATAPISHSYTVFTHLISPDGELVAQQDNMPVNGTVPTTCWRPGEIIVDRYEITAPAEVPPGNYRLDTGLYRWQTGERLPAKGEGTTTDGRVILTTIAVGVR